MISLWREYSWEAAMNYCKWRTQQENKTADIKFIYRLPKLGEWLAAYQYLINNGNTNDFSKHFSDWTMNTYFEGVSGFKSDSIFNNLILISWICPK